MKHRVWVVTLLLGALVFTSACGMVNTLLGGRSSGTVADLWSDVPRMDGLTKADLELPLAARLMVQTLTRGKMNFIAYTTTANSQAIMDFYTTERMAAAGWNSSDTTGCMGDTSTAEVGTMCVFGKQSGTGQAGDKREILAIVTATDGGTRQTAVFFVRIDVTEETVQ